MASDDEREALAKLLYNEQWAGPFCTADGDLLEWDDVADEHRAHFYAEAREVLAWQAAQQSETRITDERVERAARSLAGVSETHWAQIEADEPAKPYYRDQARAALVAALEGDNDNS